MGKYSSGVLGEDPFLEVNEWLLRILNSAIKRFPAPFNVVNDEVIVLPRFPDAEFPLSAYFKGIDLSNFPSKETDEQLRRAIDRYRSDKILTDEQRAIEVEENYRSYCPEGVCEEKVKKIVSQAVMGNSEDNTRKELELSGWIKAYEDECARHERFHENVECIKFALIFLCNEGYLRVVDLDRGKRIYAQSSQFKEPTQDGRIYNDVFSLKFAITEKGFGRLNKKFECKEFSEEKGLTLAEVVRRANNIAGGIGNFSACAAVITSLFPG